MNECVVRTSLRGSWRLLLYLKFGTFLIREITFLSEKSQGILKSDVCGNVEISTCLGLELIIILFVLLSSGQYFRLTMHSHGWLWMLLTVTDVPVYLSICICYANFMTLFLCCWKTSLRNKVTEPSSPHVQLQVH